MREDAGTVLEPCGWVHMRPCPAPSVSQEWSPALYSTVLVPGSLVTCKSGPKQKDGRCPKSPQAVWEKGEGQGMSELGLSAVHREQPDMADRACTSRDGGVQLRVGRA